MSVECEYNPFNVLLTREFVEQTLSKFCGYGICIGSLAKYQTAFVHKSVYRKNIAPPDDVVQRYLAKSGLTEPGLNPPPPIGTFNAYAHVIFTETYETMEFCGDGWIGAVVGEYVRYRFPNQTEGFYSKLKSHVVCKDGLSQLSRLMGFGKYALISSDTESLISRDNPSLLEDIFEAFCDAIVEDQGVGMLRVIIKNLIESFIDFRNIIVNDTNYKDVWKRACKEQAWPHPVYISLGDNGLSGTKREYNVGIAYPKGVDVPIRSRTTYTSASEVVECIALGTGATKKKAEQAAALNALKYLETTLNVKR